MNLNLIILHKSTILKFSLNKFINKRSVSQYLFLMYDIRMVTTTTTDNKESKVKFNFKEDKELKKEIEEILTADVNVQDAIDKLPLPLLLSPPPFSAVAAIVHSVCTLDGKGSTQYMHHALRNICNGMHATLLVLCQWCHMYLLGVLCTSATACSKGDKFLMRHALRLPHPPLQMPANASNSPKTLMGGPGTGPRV